MNAGRAAWCSNPMHAFDLETTGLLTETDRIVTGTYLRVVPGQGTPEATSWLIDPGVEIPKEAADVHGITTEHARERGVEPGPAIAEMAALLGAAWAAGEPVVIYNAPFDLTLLDRELRRHCQVGMDPARARPVIDPLVLDKKLDPYVRGKGGRKLINACRRYNIILSEQDAHTSAGDTLAACRLAWKMGGDARIRATPLGELHDRQRMWYSQQATNFADYLTRQGNHDDAKRVLEEAEHWPMRPGLPS